MLTRIEETCTLNSLVEMPVIGLGTYEAEESEAEQAVQWALECGYRSFDTASAYENERAVGRAIHESSVPREDLFITSKVWNEEQGFDETRQACERSLERLGTNYLDLYLVHWPVAAQMKATWEAMEQIKSEGLAKSIGVSNFQMHHLEELLDFAETVPAVNQVEFHPYLQQPDLRTFCRDRNIQFEAWSPLMKGRVTDIEELKQIGNKHGKTAAQVALRWELQHGVVVIPKSVHRERIAENRDIFDFELSEDEIQTIDALDRDQRTGPDPETFPG